MSSIHSTDCVFKITPRNERCLVELLLKKVTFSVTLKIVTNMH